ncbi:MAG TPA: hypothetical protein VD861_14090 [Pyrinomonadaceae bacterium]|nr:hypothetical protein [Pyrinomonadaceae bacterium]
MSKQTVQAVLFKRLRTSYSLLLTLVLTVAAATLTASALAWLGPAGKVAPTASKEELVNPPAPARSVLGQERIEAEAIVLRPTGFEPAEIRRPAGRVLLAVDNGSELQEAVLRLEREGGQVIHEVHLPRRQQKWRQVVDFTPGTYTLTEANHTDWVCRITIE